MGNSQCVDCKKEVPTGVKLFTWCLFGADGRANGFYKFFTSNTWIKIEGQGYLCPNCLARRVANEREEENRRRRAAEEAQRRAEAQRRQEEQERKRREEQRRREAEEAQRRAEAQRRQEQERKRREEQRRREAEEAQRRAEAQRRQEQERKRREEQRRREAEEAQRRAEAQRRQEEQERKRREEQRRREAEEAQRRAEAQRRQEQERKRREEHRRQRRAEAQRRQEQERKRRQEQSRQVDVNQKLWIAKQKKVELTCQNITLEAKMPYSRTNVSKMTSDLWYITSNDDIETEVTGQQTGLTSNVDFMKSKKTKTSDSLIPSIYGEHCGTSYELDGDEQKMPSHVKSVEEILREIDDLSVSGTQEVKNILELVLQNCCSFGWRAFNSEQMHHIITKQPSLKDLSFCIAEICRAVKKVKGYWPRETQLVSLYLLIKSSEEGRLLEINTGEGKSCIIAMFAVYLALSGKSVDVVSSSPILAIRDSKEWEEFYKQFQIEVGSNLTPKENDDRLKCYKKTVVYGTVGSFASDILRQEFLMEDVRGDRKFDAVIVDEVDSMLLDQGVNFTYLSSPAPGMHHIQPILLMIWNEVIRHPVIRSNQGQKYFLGKPEPLHVVLSKVIPQQRNPLEILSRLEEAGILRKGFTKEIQEQDLSNMEESLFKKEMTKEKILQCLKCVETEFKTPIEKFKMCEESLTIHKVHNDQTEEESRFQLLIVGEGLVCIVYQDLNTLCELIKAKIQSFLSTGCKDEQEPRYEFPTYLKEFVQNRLPTWIDNAFRAAIFMKEGKEYLIKDGEVVPVDYESTGVVERNTKWGDGLHQFLELKHKKKLSEMTLVTNFMSNQAFFKKYPRKLFGVSGTLGNESELSFLHRFYGGLTCTKIPTHRQKQFVEIPGIACSNKAEWLECIRRNVEEHTSDTLPKHKKRAALVICEDINTAKEIKDKLKALTPTVFTENEDEKQAVGKPFSGGDVIIATNIAGRGTDIKIDESVVKAGGLFVLVTFLPLNSRVEKQAYGRSARCGQPGSGRIVINKESLSQCCESSINIEEIRRNRDIDAQCRQEQNEKSLVSETEPKERLFSSYCQFIKEVNKQLNCKEEYESKILVSSMHEFWGLWLKMNCEDLNSKTFDELKKKLDVALQTAKMHVMDKTSPCANLYHIIRFGNEEMIKGELAEACKLYTKAIEIDKTWAAIAYYNRAYCTLLQRKDGYMAKATGDLKKAKEGFGKFKDEVMLSISLLDVLPRARDEPTTTLSQFETRCQILSFYEENIETALKELKKLSTEKKEAKAVGHNALTITLGDDKFCRKIDSEFHTFWELGLTEVVSIKEKPGFCWKGALVILFGVLQMAAGTFLVACSSGLLANIGTALIAEGINDICTGALAVYKGNQNFGKSWLTGKAASIALSIATFGFGQIKSAYEGGKGFKSAINAVKEQVETGVKRLAEKVKEIPQIAASNSFNATLKTVSGEVAVQACKEIGKRGSNYVLKNGSEELKTYFREELRRQLQRELRKVEESNGEFKKNLEKFILIHLRSGKTEQEISDAFMEIPQNALTSDNKGHFGDILKGCVNTLLSATKKHMEKNAPGVFEGFNIAAVFDMMKTACQNLSFDVGKLVSVYCNHVNKAMREIIHESQSKDVHEESLQSQEGAVCDVKHSLVKRIEEHLFHLVQDAFNSTGNSIFTQKLQNAVDGVVGAFLLDENGIGKNTLKNVLSISKKDTVCSLAKRGASTFLDEETNKKLDVVGEMGRGMKGLQGKDISSVADTVCSLAKRGASTFLDEETNKKLDVVGEMGRGMKGLQGKDISSVADTVCSLAKRGASTFLDEETNKKLDVVGEMGRGMKGLQGKDKSSVMNRPIAALQNAAQSGGQNKDSSSQESESHLFCPPDGTALTTCARGLYRLGFVQKRSEHVFRRRNQKNPTGFARGVGGNTLRRDGKKAAGQIKDRQSMLNDDLDLTKKLTKKLDEETKKHVYSGNCDMYTRGDKCVTTVYNRPENIEGCRFPFDGIQQGISVSRRKSRGWTLETTSDASSVLKKLDTFVAPVCNSPDNTKGCRFSG